MCILQRSALTTDVLLCDADYAIPSGYIRNRLRQDCACGNSNFPILQNFLKLQFNQRILIANCSNKFNFSSFYQYIDNTQTIQSYIYYRIQDEKIKNSTAETYCMPTQTHISFPCINIHEFRLNNGFE